jgi:hypothetical protein
MNEILILQQKIQETSREYDLELERVRELEEKVSYLERKKIESQDEIDFLQQQIQVTSSSLIPHHSISSLIQQHDNEIDEKENEELNQLVLQRKSIELHFESLQNRINYIPKYLSHKLMTIQSSVVHATSKIDQFQFLYSQDKLEQEKYRMEIRKEQLHERFQIKKYMIELQLKEVELQVQEEEQTLNLILACIESIHRKNDQLKYGSNTTRNETSTSMHHSSDQSYPEEEQFSKQTNENLNHRETSYDHNYPSYQPQQQTQPPWFRMVKRRKVIDEYTTSNREYKTATDILVEQEQLEEWTEVRFSSG